MTTSAEEKHPAANNLAHRLPLEFKSLSGLIRKGSFSCGNNESEREINNWFHKEADEDHLALKKRCVVATFEGKEDVIGFFCMTTKQESVTDLFGRGVNLRGPEKMTPVVLLSLLAVDKRYQRNGYGSIILAKAVQSFYEVVMATGIPALVLQCIDNETKAFYQKLGFKEYYKSASAPKLYLPAPEAIEIIERGQRQSAISN